MPATAIAAEAIDERVLHLKLKKSSIATLSDEQGQKQSLGDNWSLNHDPLAIKYQGQKLLELVEGIEASDEGGLDLEDEEEGWLSFAHTTPDSAKVFGLGEKTGPLDKSGASYEMWNLDAMGPFALNQDPLYVSIPFYIVADPEQNNFYGVYIDHPGRSQFDLRSQVDKNKIGVAVNGSSIEVYIIKGEEVADIVETYTQITGRPFLPPRWSLGYQHSKYGYPNNKEEALELAYKFREEEMPCDVLYFDIQYMDDYKVFQWDEDRYGSPEDLIREVHGLNFKVVNIVEPGVKAEDGFSVYEDGKEKDVFVRNKEGEIYQGAVWPGFCAFPDFFNDEVRDWWVDQHQQFLEQGVDGIWNDMNEPAIFFGRQQIQEVSEEILTRLKREEDLALDFMMRLRSLTERAADDWVHEVQGEQVPHERVHNKYGYFEDKATFHAFAKYKPNERPFILTRSGFAGVQKYAAIWTGDNASSWEDMKQSVPQLLNLGLSGVPFVGPDVGGFGGDVSPELLTRWLQLGAFYPFFRNHSMIKTAPQEPWTHGEPYQSINRKYLRLRYQLLPYLYTLFYETHNTGKPPMRPLLLEFPQDEYSYTIQDEFMLGASLLVAPVLEQGKKKLHVYLPYERGKEIEWKGWWTGEILTSGHHLVDAPLEKIPIFIKQDTGVPIFKNKRKHSQQVPNKLTLKAHVKKEATVPIYYDDGHSRDFEQGEYLLGSYVIREEGSGHEVDLEVKHAGHDLPWRDVVLDL